MALTDYVKFDDIRAALGVSADEIEDTTLSLELYESDLLSQLEELGEEVNQDLLELYEPFKEDADVEAMSKNEARFYRAMRSFSTYAVAKHLCTALPLFSPKDITDGKASTSRYASNPYKDTIEGIAGQFDLNRTRLLQAVAALGSTSVATPTSRVYMSRVAPATDPITGA